MVLDLNFFLFAVPAVIFAGMSKGGFGSAASFAATPILALILTPGQAIGLMLPLLMIMDVTALRVFWRKWDTRVAKALILGSIPGLLIGGLLYGIADPNLFKILIGLVAIGFVFYQWSKSLGWLRPPTRELGTAGGWFWGSVMGFTSFISHAGGPPAAVYMLTKGMDKTTYQATSVIVFWVVNILKFIPYFALGIFSKDTFVADVYLIPVAIAGVFIGAWLHKKMSDRLYFWLAYAFLLITGTKLIWDAVT